MPGAITRMGVAYKKEIDRIISNILDDNLDPNTFNVTMTFVSKITQDSISLSREIDSINIKQDFILNYTDKITAKLSLTNANYKWFIYNRNDLFCKLTFTKVNLRRKIPRTGTPLIERTYRCIILTTADIDKILPAGVNEDKDKPKLDRNIAFYNLEIELIEDKIYKARKLRLNAIARGDGKDSVDIETMIYFAIGYFGFTKACVVTPDNDKKYENFVIPPSYGIRDIMGFFQTSPGHGVYSNGFCSYITNECWFVYPRYGAYLTKYPVHFYKLAPGMLAGANAYDWKEVPADGSDVTVHILLPDDVEERNVSLLGYENHPNTFSMQMSENVIDNCRTVMEDNVFLMEPRIRNSAFEVNPMDIPDEDNPISLEFRYSHSNMYTIKSESVAYDQTELNLLWRMAVPFTMTPGAIVSFNYEHRSGDDLVMKTMFGACEYVEYNFVRDKESRLYPVFTGIANIRLACNNHLARSGGMV